MIYIEKYVYIYVHVMHIHTHIHIITVGVDIGQREKQIKEQLRKEMHTSVE